MEQIFSIFFGPELGVYPELNPINPQQPSNMS